MKTIVINGANGFVAANFINKLLLLDYKVIALVRANKHPAEERMKNALTKMNDGETINIKNLKVYNYSLLDENFSILEECLQEIFKGEVDYFHFAASLKYDLKSKEEIFETNIRGIENSIEVYLRYAKNNSRFFFISTAYSCGKFQGLFEEEFYTTHDISEFRNYYEQSKRFAENVIKKNIDENNLKASIIRLSQVVGNNQSGVTKTDYGIFDFAKRVQSLSSRYPNRTIRVHVDPDAAQNLIPINTVVDGLLSIIETSDAPTVMNFVAKNPIKNIYIIDSINKLLPINIIPVKYLNSKEMTALEKVIAAGMSFTRSYTNTNLLFATQKRDLMIRSVDGEPNEQRIFKMLEYFLDHLSKKRNQTKVDSHNFKECYS